MILSLIAALGGCKKPEDDDTGETGKTGDTGNGGAFEPKSVTLANEFVTPSSLGTNQTLVAGNDGNAYVTTKDWYAMTAAIRPVGANGFTGAAESLPHADTYNYGWGIQTENGTLLVPYQEFFDNTHHGVVALNADGSLRADHTFGATLGLTGPGAVAQSDGLAVAVLNNADYAAGPAYDSDSALVRFDPDRTDAGNYDIIALPDSVNAAGLAVSGQTAWVASVGDYVDPATASFSRVDLASGETVARVDSVLGFGLNGNLPRACGYTLLAGYNPSAQIALHDGDSVNVLSLPDGCVGDGSVSMAQFVTCDGADMQILAGATDYAAGETRVVSITGNADDDAWECETVATSPSAYGAGLVGGGATYYAATDTTVLVLTAE